MDPIAEQLIFGRHPVLEAIREGRPIDRLFIQQGVRGDFEKEIRHLSREHTIPLQVVPRERIDQLVRGNHQGIVGVLSAIDYYSLDEVLPAIYERSENPLLILLDSITDVRNFGAIARSAEVCGAHALVIPRKGSAMINAEAIKTSAGALNRIPVCRESSLLKAVETIKLSGIHILTGELQAQKPLFDLDLRGPVAFILGAEGRGVSRELIRAADETFIIPQRGQTDSFNVSVAAGIMLYETMRQRWRHPV